MNSGRFVGELVRAESALQEQPSEEEPFLFKVYLKKFRVLEQIQELNSVQPRKEKKTGAWAKVVEEACWVCQNMQIFRRFKTAVNFQCAKQAQSSFKQQSLLNEQLTVYHRLLMSNLAQQVRLAFEDCEYASRGGMSIQVQFQELMTVKKYMKKTVKTLGDSGSPKISNFKAIKKLKECVAKMAKFKEGEQKSGAAELCLSYYANKITENQLLFQGELESGVQEQKKSRRKKDEFLVLDWDQPEYDEFEAANPGISFSRFKPDNLSELLVCFCEEPSFLEELNHKIVDIDPMNDQFSRIYEKSIEHKQFPKRVDEVWLSERPCEQPEGPLGHQEGLVESNLKHLVNVGQFLFGGSEGGEVKSKSYSLRHLLYSGVLSKCRNKILKYQRRADESSVKVTDFESLESEKYLTGLVGRGPIQFLVNRYVQMFGSNWEAVAESLKLCPLSKSSLLNASIVELLYIYHKAKATGERIFCQQKYHPTKLPVHKSKCENNPPPKDLIQKFSQYSCKNSKKALKPFYQFGFRQVNAEFQKHARKWPESKPTSLFYDAMMRNCGEKLVAMRNQLRGGATDKPTKQEPIPELADQGLKFKAKSNKVWLYVPIRKKKDERPLNPAILKSIKYKGINPAPSIAAMKPQPVNPPKRPNKPKPSNASETSSVVNVQPTLAKPPPAKNQKKQR